MNGFLGDVWSLAAPYWRSEERWRARLTLVGLLAIKFTTIWVCVAQNRWYNTFYTAIQAHDLPAFWAQVLLFGGLGLALTVLHVQAHWMAWTIKTRWRAWMVRRYTQDWLTNRIYYRMQIEGDDVRNPDQRIAEDIGLFTDRTLDLTVGFLDVAVSLISFTTILWGLSGTLDLLGFALPGYMVFAVFAYTLTCSYLTHRLGRPLIGIFSDRATLEADFRYGLLRIREHAEAVAFHRGEPAETAILSGRWSRIYANIWQGLRGERRLFWFTNAYGQVSIIMPFLLVVPKFFSGAMTFGEVMQVTAAFGAVAACLAYFINQYQQIAHWQAETQRVKALREMLDRRLAEPGSNLTVDAVSGDLDITGLGLSVPGGREILSGLNLTVPAGTKLLVRGPSGSGKSTLLRAIAGIWPLATGRVRLDPGTAQFLPQRPYLPLGPLRSALTYPAAENASPEALEAILGRVGLAHLVPHLDEVDHWDKRLSGGEQQRIAFARIFLARPATIFLDEATSALDEDLERSLYEGLRQAEWNPTVISIGHRSTLVAYHDDVLTLRAAA
jgi:putative ATP-binding cassette transporter